ncbi:MAG: hypothetical protein ACR2H6_05460 [Pyrinomonadaceae bacterium]
MKRCPQCEFIYEDEQTRCDMDGIDLVLDNPTPSVTSPKPPPRAKRNTSRRSVLSVCGVVLGVLIFAVGFASLERAVSVSSEQASPSQAAVSQTAPQEEMANRPPKTAVEPVEPVAQKGPVAEDPAVTMVSNTAKASHIAAREPARELASKPAAEPLQQNSLGTRGVVLGSLPRQNRIDAARSQPGMIRSNTSPPAAKKDSKVVSMVKKTGRFFKKAF